MAAITTQSVSNGALTTPTAITPTAADTIARSQFGPNGVLLRIITTGTATTLTVSDPTTTDLGNAGTPASQTCPATGSRMAFVPLAAINPADSDRATINFSGALTGVTYEAYRV
ncbi:hypothetical protein Drose_04150 [Dactylosporangium roseum]|uniref:Uncharacterized protein n=1 Tax=Dactylosporangium roseum TaxID=47989 RepID=A0ABY5Z637_9ACTN|nr:hypothetical protein [Dactylosporangium roseum]UWZ37481.1 hypothetical protein Drose_04150 [Dactylosporangium roseum]